MSQERGGFSSRRQFCDRCQKLRVILPAVKEAYGLNLCQRCYAEAVRPAEKKVSDILLKHDVYLNCYECGGLAEEAINELNMAVYMGTTPKETNPTSEL